MSTQISTFHINQVKSTLFGAYDSIQIVSKQLYSVKLENSVLK